MLEIAQTVKSSTFQKGGNDPHPIMEVHSGLSVKEFSPLPLANSPTDTQRTKDFLFLRYDYYFYNKNNSN